MSFVNSVNSAGLPFPPNTHRDDGNFFQSFVDVFSVFTMLVRPMSMEAIPLFDIHDKTVSKIFCCLFFQNYAV